MQIIEHATEFHISFPFGKLFKRNMVAVKALPGRQWEKEKKIWRVPIRFKDAVYELRDTHRAKILLASAATPEQIGELSPMPELSVELPIKAILRPYQGQGVAQNMIFGSSLNGDEPGLGKTIQSIASVLALNAFPCLVICPSSLKLNWQREWQKFTDKRAMILDDKTRITWHQYYKVGMVDVFIVNYESLKKFFVVSMPEKLRGKSNGHSSGYVMRDTVNLFSTVIVDESHRCKNEDTLTSKLTLRITHKKQHVFALSGTPVVNKPKDLWPQLAIINRLHLFGGKKGFLDRYCEGGRGANNLKELNYLLRKHCFFRREKKEVLKDLPPKQRQIIECDIATRDEYNKAVRDFSSYLKASGCSDADIARKMKGEIMVKIGILRQISARGKLNEVKEYVEDILAAGEKIVLFCNLHEIVDELKRMFPCSMTITGRDSDQQKQAAVDRFQKDPNCQVAILNIRAGGVGHTLTASSRVGFVEFPWHPADCVQCEDRCHRIGQNDSVMAGYFLGKDTIDERLFEIIQEKAETANAVTGSSDDMEMEVVSKIIDLFNI
ncbi:DEAD/DEAH box helicase [Chitinophaga tropicalis]|uniref:Helicase n=1 Tax=Chitinophaga tropicalis TaxID=2683588 RepID=A0A7K1UAI2_9BACT|nr:DEAD/DEAH box helicase [Chitinophaga tropicalis]MVT11353.1 hypothetical protein [Chitinophaga tropicalis]